MASGQRQTAQIEWRDDSTPISSRFNDPYFSLNDGLAETRHVFLAGNQLPERFKPGFHIAELGFGTGLNMLATWHLWRQSNQTGTLQFTSFEAYPMAVSDMRKSLTMFSELNDIADEFLHHWKDSMSSVHLDQLDLTVIQGDANQTLSQWQGYADAWFLDGFSPAKNPELWNEKLLAEVAAHTTPNGTFATYTAAGHIRRTLTEVGFKTDRVAGYGRKRHMNIGQLKGQT